MLSLSVTNRETRENDWQSQQEGFPSSLQSVSSFIIPFLSFLSFSWNRSCCFSIRQTLLLSRLITSFSKLVICPVVFMLFLSFTSFRWSLTMICLSCLHEGLILDTHFRKFLCLLSLSIEHETGGSCKVSSLISNSIHYKEETQGRDKKRVMRDGHEWVTEKKDGDAFFLINTGGKTGLLKILFANMSHRIISHFLIVHLFSNSLTLFDTDSIFSIPFFWNQNRLEDDEIVENAMKGEVNISQTDSGNKENCVIQWHCNSVSFL